MSDRGRRWPRHWPIVVLLTATVIFLWTPLTTGGYYASTDILQRSALLKVSGPDIREGNGVLGDPVLQMHPFLRWNRDQLRAGSLPTWNPYNGGGTPHLANYQSAVFAPFSAPFYVLSFRHALVAAAFLKVFCLGLFTYLWLRLLRLNPMAALAGALAFMFGGYNVLWLNWPQGNVTVALPAMLYTAEAALQVPPTQRLRRIRWLLGFALATAAGLLGGHPETFFFCSVLVAGYLLARTLWLRKESHPARLLVEFAMAGIAGALLAAVQLLPFVEYLTRSSVYGRRSLVGQHAQFRLVALQAFPNLFGNPTTHYYNPRALLNSNYNEVNSGYIGLAVLLLAGLGLIVALAGRSRHRRLSAFFAVAAGGWWVYAYDPGGVRNAVNWLPGARSLAEGRSFPIWLLSISVLAAIGVDRFTSEEVGCRARQVRVRRALAVAITAVAALAIVVLIADVARSWANHLPGRAASELAARNQVDQHVAMMVVTTLVAVAGMAAAVAASQPRARRVSAAVVLVVIFAQSGVLLRDYNPMISRRLFYPVPAALRDLTALTGGENTLHLKGARLWPDANLWYRLPSPASYDAVGVKTYDRLAARALGTNESEDESRPTSAAGLRALGIRFVVTTGRDPLQGKPDRLIEMWSKPPLRLFRVPGAPPRYFTVSGAERVADDEAGMQRLLEPHFDVNSVVLVRDVAAAPGTGRGTVTVLEDGPTHVRLAVDRSGPGWLVVLRTHYPGWRATVNGHSASLARANVAFSAVRVPAGRSLVELSYRPASVRIGAGLSVVTVVFLFAAAVASIGPRLPRHDYRPGGATVA